MKPRLNSIWFSVFLVFCPRLAAYDIKLYPASEVYDVDPEYLHERLGVDGQQMWVEEFEDEQLASWLTTNVKTGNEGTPDLAWAGERASSPADSGEFQIQLPNARVVGIGLGNDDGGEERLSINGNTPIELKRFPGFEGNGIARAYYLVVIATPNDSDIRSIVIDHGTTIAFDHLMVLQSKEPPSGKKLPPRLILRLNDGSHLTGFANTDTISILNGTEKIELAWERIYSMRCQAAGNKVTILLRNGEKLSGELQTAQLKLTTKKGQISFASEEIKELKVTPRGEFSPIDARSDFSREASDVLARIETPERL